MVRASPRHFYSTRFIVYGVLADTLGVRRYSATDYPSGLWRCVGVMLSALASLRLRET